MYCPRCSTEQISDETSFCSKCGLALDAISHLVANDGIAHDIHKSRALTRRQRALKQGACLLLTAMAALPITALIVLATGSALSQMFIPSAILAIFAVLHVAWALAYESYLHGGHESEAGRVSTVEAAARRLNTAPAKLNVPATSLFSTNELVPTPVSVTEHTTKLLGDEE